MAREWPRARRRARLIHDDPAARQELEPDLARGSLRGAQQQPEGVLGPGDEFAAVALIRPGLGDLGVFQAQARRRGRCPSVRGRGLRGL